MNPERCLRGAPHLFTALAHDPELSQKWSQAAPDVRQAYLEWIAKPRRRRERRRRAASVVEQLSVLETLHFQPRQVSWWDVLPFG